MQQAAFTCAAIVFYSKPFIKNNKSNFSKHLISTYNADDRKLHDIVIDLRNQVYGHSDARRYDIEPFKIGDLTGVLFLDEAFKLTPEQERRLRKMLVSVIEETERAVEKLI